ncbi:hypothetical protein GGS20DRAFT_361908 [Poronia punctata]|nr:hypothetical protein GGS20DRAFT_361908 [Poronia punctata]
MDNRKRKSAVGRPRKACNICKAQKIRCTEERPSCKRCVRLQHRCVYGEPSSSSSSPVIIIPEPETQTQTETDPSTLLSNNNNNSLVLELVDIYFDHMYNSHLLLHKRSFITDVVERRACGHVLLSVCAWGAKFYQDSDGNRSLLRDAESWAERAGKLVFQYIEELAHENIVTCLNLAIFWHSIGSWRRGYLYRGTAFLLPDILGFGPNKTANSLESEIRRRRFWACYIMHAHTGGGNTQFEAKGDVLTLPLPWSDEDFEAGISRRPRHISLSSEEIDDHDSSLFAVFIKATTFWQSVTTLLKSSDPSPHVRIPAILALEDQIEKWWESPSSVPPPLKLTPSNLSTVPKNLILRLLHLNTLYHQLLCSLHASLVPLFCGSPSVGAGDTALQISAQVAFDHATQLSSLISAFLSQQQGTTSLVPLFMGYAAYCGCAVQIPFMWCANPTVRERAIANVRTNTKLLQLMSVDWKFTSILNAYVHYLYTVHSKRAVILDDEPRGIPRDKLSCLNSQVENNRTSIYEYILMLRNDEEEGHGSPDDEEEDMPPVNIAERAREKILQGAPGNSYENEDGNGSSEVMQHQTGTMFNLMNPFDTEAFAYDDDMLDFQPSLAGQFGFTFDLSSWGDKR